MYCAGCDVPEGAGLERLYMYIYIYIYIQREREREREIIVSCAGRDVPEGAHGRRPARHRRHGGGGRDLEV